MGGRQLQRTRWASPRVCNFTVPCPSSCRLRNISAKGQTSHTQVERSQRLRLLRVSVRLLLLTVSVSFCGWLLLLLPALFAPFVRIFPG